MPGSLGSAPLWGPRVFCTRWLKWSEGGEERFPGVLNTGVPGVLNTGVPGTVVPTPIGGGWTLLQLD